MQNYGEIRKFMGKSITEDDLEYFDCYCSGGFGLMIPTESPDAESLYKSPCHPCYSLFIFFERDVRGLEYYYGDLFSPGIVHDNRTRLHHYCLLFEKEFFEERFKKYSEELEVYNCRSVKLYGDILGLLNSFALEYVREEQNREAVLNSLAEIIANKVIRGILREDISGAKPVSADYSVAAAQLYMEGRYWEDINVTKLSNLGYELIACFMRRFKKETGLTPMEYLLGVRLRKACDMLKKESEVSAAEIAESCGFETEEKFRVKFGERFGVSPEGYRETHKTVKAAAEKVEEQLV
ncbi:MAG: helix-turn-helix domain-containing protein [Ruminococcus sp.]|nr:helix-turn-helix domain-containing protein [Ruminococcus sp.]